MTKNKNDEKEIYLAQQVANILSGNTYYAYDIGASVELPEHWQRLSKGLSFIAVDPDKIAAKALKEKYKNISYSVTDQGLSETGGDQILYCPPTPTGSSLLKFDDSNPYLIHKNIAPLKEVPITTITFDQLVKQNGNNEVNLIKLDTQGSELSILRGLSPSHYDNCLGLEIEIGTPGGYQQQPSVNDYNHFLYAKGFEIFDVRPSKAYHKGLKQNQRYYLNELLGVYDSSPTVSRKVWELDILYLRSPENLLKTKNLSLIRKGIVTFCIYNYFIEALYTIELLEKESLISSEEINKLKNSVLEIHNKKEFKGIFSNSKLWTMARNLLAKFRIRPRSTQYWSGYMYQGE